MKSRRFLPGDLRFLVLSAASIALALTMAAGCSATLVTSKWKGDRIKIDGDAGDWSDSTASFGNDDAAFKITNDEEYLYLLMVTQKREIARLIVTRGLTIWFDPNGGDKKTIGLHYPVGVGAAGRFQQDGVPLGPEQGGDFRGRLMEEVEFWGPTVRDRVHFRRAQGKGIEVQFGEHDARFVYEARVPLIFSLEHPYAIETSTGSTIGVTIETTTAREALGGGEQRAGAPGGGRGGGLGGGGRGGRGGVGGGGQPSRGAEITQFEPVKVKLRLADRTEPK